MNRRKFLLGAAALALLPSAAEAAGFLFFAKSATPIVFAERQVGTGCDMPSASQTLGAATLAKFRTVHTICNDTATLKFAFPGWYVTSSDFEIGISGTPTFKASAEINGTLVHIKFSGIDTGSLTPGAIVWSDEIAAAAFGRAQFDAGLLCFVKTEYTVTVGNQLPINHDGTFSGGGEGVYFGGSSQVYSTGSLTSAGGGTSQPTRMFRPIALVGKHSGVAIAAIGDSITAGTNSNEKSAGYGSTSSGGGWFQRTLYAQSIAGLKLARAGTTVSGFIAGHAVQRLSLLPYCTHAVSQLGFNDLSAGGDQSATLLANLRTMWGQFNTANSSITIEQGFITLKCSSSDSFATLANQTVTSGWSAGGGEVVNVNNGIVANVGSNNLNGYFNLRPGMSDTVVTDKWKVNGSSNYATPDGTHPQPVIAGNMATIAGPIFTSWIGTNWAAIDGRLTAPAATIQYPSLLVGYAARPPWYVAGVDYAVGYPTGTALTDWRTITPTGSINVDVAGNIITISGSSTITLNAIDFSLGSGCQVNVTNTGQTNITNSKFITTFASGGTASIPLTSVNSGPINFSNNVVDGTGSAGAAAGMITIANGSAPVTLTLKYNWIRLGTQDDMVNVASNQGGALSIDSRWNLFEGGTHSALQHGDWLQTQGDGSVYTSITFQFNTYKAQADTGGSQGIMITSNNHSPAYPVFSAIDISYNTMQVLAGANVNYTIAIADSMLNGSAIVQQNYIDPTGIGVSWFGPGDAGGPYTGTVTKTGNINMVTAAVLT